MANGNQLAQVQHFVVLMLENRSFDHMLGFLYADAGNVSPAGQPFEGLTGTESNPDAAGQQVTVFRIEPTTPNAYFMPGADPGEGYMATNSQLFGGTAGPANPTDMPGMQGFVKDFGYTLGWQSREHGYWSIVPGTVPDDIMGCFTPDALPVRPSRRGTPRRRASATFSPLAPRGPTTCSRTSRSRHRAAVRRPRSRRRTCRRFRPI